MQSITVIPEEEFISSEWSGGVTTELFIWPEGSSYRERRFRARISTAVCQLEESHFTPLPGVRRFLTPLCPGFELTVNGKKKLLPHGEVLEFSGGDDVTCRGSGRDLNLMLKGAEGSMRILTGAFTVGRGETAFVYAEHGAVLAACFGQSFCTSAFLHAGAFARLAPGSYNAHAPIVLFTVETGDPA